MKCFYINLDDASGRRAEIEGSFAALAPRGWELVRVRALTPLDVAAVPGSRSAPEKACLLSHRKALALALAEPDPSLIVEDDTRFCARTFPVLEQMARTAGDWDLLFTDLTLLNLDHQVDLFKACRRLVADRQFALKDLRHIPFAATSGYLVGARGKARLAALVDALPAVDRPYDLQLLRWVREAALSARMTLPFLTTVTAAAADSSIQPDASRLRGGVLNALRGLLFIDRDVADLERQVAAFAPPGDAADQLLGRLLALVASEEFPNQV